MKKENENWGFLLVNKPSGITSHDVVEVLRKITGIKKIGHGGTLDPIATGLLIVGIGRRATKKLKEIQALNKEYLAKVRLGRVSNTYDREGKIQEMKIEKIPTFEEVQEVIKTFVGEIEQIPPPFSAKKINGKRAYQLARRGIMVKLKPQKIKIYDIEILKYSFPFLEIKVICSSGTYIRTLAHEIGKKLNCGAYLEELTRTKIGNFSIERAINLQHLDSKNWKKFLIQIEKE